MKVKMCCNYKRLEKDKPVTEANVAEITLKSAEIVERINPSKFDDSTAYKYLYPSEEGDLLVDVQFTVKNLKEEKYLAHKLVGVKGVFDGTENSKVRMPVYRQLGLGRGCCKDHSCKVYRPYHGQCRGRNC